MALRTRQPFVAYMASRHDRQLRRFLSARLRNPADVPDLAQEVYLRLLRVPRHDTIRRPEAYLLTIAGHVVHQRAGSGQPVQQPERHRFARPGG